MKKKSKLPMMIGAATLVIVGSITVFNSLQATKVAKTDVDASLPVVTVYKSETCGCCNKWVKHMEDNGFRVEAHNVTNLVKYKHQAKLGAGLGSCHTAFVDGYAIEGHVPAKDVKRLLLEKPDISGITVPAMPKGSPGMEVPGQPADPYKVISFKEGKEVGVFSEY